MGALRLIRNAALLKCAAPPSGRGINLAASAKDIERTPAAL